MAEIPFVIADALRQLLLQAQPRPDLITPGSTGSLENARPATFMGRVTRGNESLEDLLGRFPQGELESGGQVLSNLAPSSLAIALGPFTTARNRAPGDLLRLRNEVQGVLGDVGVPDDTKAFLAGGYARGFGRYKQGRFPGLKPKAPDYDIIVGMTPESIRQMAPNAARQIGMMQDLQERGFPWSLTTGGDWERAVDNWMRGELSKALAKRNAPPIGSSAWYSALSHELADLAPDTIAGHPVDWLVRPIDQVGKGFTGYDPVIELPMRRRR